MWCFLIFLFSFFVLAAESRAEAVKIVSWNASPALDERLNVRLDDFKALSNEIDPDVLVLIEITGVSAVRRIVKAMGWNEYHAVVTDWALLSDNAFFALEAAVLSKIPIERAVEYDSSPDGHTEVFSNKGVLAGRVAEQKLSTSGIPGFGSPLGKHDRGTIRVDLANGLTLFPLHLKSNRNSACFAVKETIRIFQQDKNSKITPALQEAYDTGFTGATKQTVLNAVKRERVMAATVKIANEAIVEGRTVLIAGDFNTGFEQGKYGYKVPDCLLQEFTCKEGPFPAVACANGDGFDDTLGILEEGLVGSTKWKVLSRNLGRTFESPVFADRAIDHIAVPVAVQKWFTPAMRARHTYGSDHFPIMTEFFK